MKTILIVLAIAVGVLALMMAGLGLKMLLRKEKEFHRPCANADPSERRAGSKHVCLYELERGGRSQPKTGRCANCTCDKKNLRN